MNYSNGKHLLNLEEYEQAFELFETGAQAGDPKCIYGMIATLASANMDFSKHLHECACLLPELLRIANEKKDKDVCFIVGRCHEVGLCTAVNIEKAVEYYTAAADLGNEDAMFNLGCIFLQQTNDIETATTRYFLPSADLGSTNAQLAVAHYYDKNGNRENALLWYSRAAKDGSVRTKEILKNFLANRTK